MTEARGLHEEWMRDPEYRKAYERSDPEFERLDANLERAREAHGIAHAPPPGGAGSPPLRRGGANGMFRHPRRATERRA